MVQETKVPLTCPSARPQAPQHCAVQAVPARMRKPHFSPAPWPPHALRNREELRSRQRYVNRRSRALKALGAHDLAAEAFGCHRGAALCRSTLGRFKTRIDVDITRLFVKTT